MQGALKNNRIG